METSTLLRRGAVLVLVALCSILLVSKICGNSVLVTSLESRRLEASSTPTDKKVDYAKAQALTESLLSLIRARYELDGMGAQFFLTANNIEAESFDILKYKFAVKMLSPKLDEDYLMIFGGSSVTASHDNYYNQSYPAIVGKRLGPILAAMGIKIVIHNIAQGANNCSPYTLCYESMGGLDPEFVGWEQSYNCGHDEAIFELAARIAAGSKNKGIVYYSASGAWSPSGCPASPDKKPFSAEDWTPADAGIAPWTPALKDVLAEKELLNKYAKAASSSKRFHGYNSRGEYRAAAPIGFNVWESNPLCKGRDKEDTKDITNCNGIDSAQGCKMRFMTKEAAAYGSDTGKGANWHPTRAFHLLRGEAISWLYGLAILEALLTVQQVRACACVYVCVCVFLSIWVVSDWGSVFFVLLLFTPSTSLPSLPPSNRLLPHTHTTYQDLKSKPAAALLADYASKLAALQPPLPAPKKCQSYHCDQRPMCFTGGCFFLGGGFRL